jgi:hypothetical protein
MNVIQMVIRWSSIDGDVRTKLAAAGLATRLSNAGINVQVERWSHRESGYYIHILETDDLTLSQVSRKGFQADGVSASVRTMRGAARRLSAVLTDLKIRHRFNVYGGRPRRVEYLHYLWPKDAPPLSSRAHNPERNPPDKLAMGHRRQSGTRSTSTLLPVEYATDSALKPTALSYLAERVYQTLKGRVSADEPRLSYRELIQSVGQLAPPDNNLMPQDDRLLAALGEICRACHTHNPRLPALPCLVVNEREHGTLGTPGLVYYHDAHQGVHGRKAKHAAWLEEYQRAKTTTYPESI